MRELAREFDLGGLILFSRNVEAPEQVAELALAARVAAAGAAALVQRRPGGRAGQRLKEPFTRWPPMVTLGRAKDAALRRPLRQGAGAELARRRHHARLRAGPRRPDQREEPGHWRPRALRPRRGRRHARAASSRRCRAPGSPPPASTSPGTATPASTRTSTCRCCELPPDRLRAVELVPFRAAIAADVACMLTCHVLFTEIDEEHPATLSPRIVQGAAEGRARLPGRGDHRRPRHEGDRRPLHHRGDGGARAARRLRRLPDLQRRLRQEGARARGASSARPKADMGFAKRVEDAIAADAPAEGALPRRRRARALDPDRLARARRRSSTRSWPRRCGAGL